MPLVVVEGALQFQDDARRIDPGLGRSTGLGAAVRQFDLSGEIECLAPHQHDAGAGVAEVQKCDSRGCHGQQGREISQAEFGHIDRIEAQGAGERLGMRLDRAAAGRYL